jgi:hypothetical protein
MRWFSAIVCSCLILISFASLAAQQLPAAPANPFPPQGDPRAVALLQRSLTALAEGAGIKDVTLTGDAHSIVGGADESGTVSLKATGVDSRIDLSLGSGNRSEIRNHDAVPLPGSLPSGVPPAAAQAPQPVGVWLGPDGVPHEIAEHNLMTDPAWFFPEFTLANFADSQSSWLSYIGQENYDGQLVLHISSSQQFADIAGAAAQTTALLQHLSKMDLYLDPTTLLPVALAFSVHPDDNAIVDVPVEIRFSGYQSVEGIQVPLHVQKYVNNSLVLDLQLSDPIFNSGLTASDFAIQ